MQYVNVNNKRFLVTSLNKFSGRTLANKRYKYSWAERKGREMFAQGLTCPYAGNTRWIAHAIERGWRRAWMEQQKTKKL